MQPAEMGRSDHQPRPSGGDERVIGGPDLKRPGPSTLLLASGRPERNSSPYSADASIEPRSEPAATMTRSRPCALARYIAESAARMSCAAEVPCSG